jgi:hypothetical protein
MLCRLASGETSGKGSGVNSEASQVLANIVNTAEKDSKAEIAQVAASAIPDLSPQQAEVLTTLLTEMAPNVTPEMVQESVEIVADSGMYIHMSASKSNVIIPVKWGKLEVHSLS